MGYFHIFFLAWGLVIVLNFIFWLIYLYERKPAIVDLSWSIGVTVASTAFLLQETLTPPRVFFLSLLAFWSGRLCGYILLTRFKEDYKDQRYELLQQRWQKLKSANLLIQLQIQGMLMLVVALPFYFLGSSAITMSWHKLAIYTLIFFAIVGQGTADSQLYLFKERDKSHVCKTGLWAQCRHPNYFFECLIWLGFFSLACFVPLGWVSILSPLTLYFMFNTTIIPLTEKASVINHGEFYVSYQQSTPKFFPKLIHIFRKQHS